MIRNSIQFNSPGLGSFSASSSKHHCEPNFESIVSWVRQHRPFHVVNVILNTSGHCVGNSQLETSYSNLMSFQPSQNGVSSYANSQARKLKKLQSKYHTGSPLFPSDNPWSKVLSVQTKVGLYACPDPSGVNNAHACP